MKVQGEIFTYSRMTLTLTAKANILSFSTGNDNITFSFSVLSLLLSGFL
jgi:hypothetical protein